MAPAPQPTHSARRGAGPAPPRARATPAPRPRGRRCPDCHGGRSSCTPAARRPGARRRARRPRRRRSGCEVMSCTPAARRPGARRRARRPRRRDRLREVQPSKLGIAPSSRSAARAAAAPSPIWLPARSSVSTFRSPPPACAARSASHHRAPLRVVPPQVDVGERDDRRHLRGEGLAVDGRHDPHVAAIGELDRTGRDARLEHRGKRRGRHRRLARGPAVRAHLEQVRLLARQALQADEGPEVLDEAARLALHHAPAPPGVRLHVGVRARGEVGVDEEHVRLWVGVPEVDRPGTRGAGSAGVGGGRCGRAAGRRRRTCSERLKVASSSGVRSSSGLPRERCGIET